LLNEICQEPDSAVLRYGRRVRCVAAN
jgi:hypothetical protein